MTLKIQKPYLRILSTTWKPIKLEYPEIFHNIPEGMPKSYVKFEDFRWHAPFLIIFQVFLLPKSPYYHASEHLLLTSYYTYSSYYTFCFENFLWFSIIRTERSSFFSNLFGKKWSFVDFSPKNNKETVETFIRPVLIIGS